MSKESTGRIEAASARLKEEDRRQRIDRLKSLGRTALLIAITGGVVFASAAVIGACTPSPAPSVSEIGCVVKLNHGDKPYAVGLRGNTGPALLEKLNPGENINSLEPGDDMNLLRCGDLGEDHQVSPRD